MVVRPQWKRRQEPRRVDDAEATGEFWSRDYKNEGTQALSLTTRGDPVQQIDVPLWSGLAADAASMVEATIVVLVKIRERVRDAGFELAEFQEFIAEIDGCLDERRAIVKPVLHLLSGRPDLGSARAAYEEAVDELASGVNDNAIASACRALGMTLDSLGYAGRSLHDQTSEVSNEGSFRSHDVALLDWVSRYASASDTSATRDDAWLVVHAVGALVLRLVGPSEGAAPALQRR